MSFQDSLKQTQTLLQKELGVFFEKKRKEAEKIDPEFVSVIDQIADLTLRGGKRVRPFLCWLGFTINSKLKIKNSKLPLNLIHCMIGLELFHTFALIHDDIIDQDEKRRERPTIHEYFKSKVKSPLGNTRDRQKSKVQNVKHYGMSMAILAGDLALSWADECMGKVKSPLGNTRDRQKSKVNARILMAYQRMKEQALLGQSLDVMRQFGFAGISQTKINELKTAWYSVVWPLTIGALLANAPQKDILRLQSYGLLVGQAFQLRDDLMDGDIGKEDFTSQTQTYKKKVDKAIDAFQFDDQRKKLLSDVAAFVIARHS